MTETKMTKAMWLEELHLMVEASDREDKEGMLEFIESQQEMLAHKAEKAREYAQKRKAANDELKEEVYGVLTEDFQTIDEIYAQVETPDVSRAKVTARLTALVREERVTKDVAKYEGGKRLTVYKLA